MFIHKNGDARFDSIFSEGTEEKSHVSFPLKSMIADFFLNDNILLCTQTKLLLCFEIEFEIVKTKVLNLR